MKMNVMGDKISRQNKRQINAEQKICTGTVELDSSKYYFQKQMAAKISGSFVIEMPVTKQNC